MTTTPDVLPEPAADPFKGMRCPTCNTLPSLAVGLPAFLTFHEGGTATIGVDTAELPDFGEDDLTYNHADGCDYRGQDMGLRAIAVPLVHPLARYVADHAAPELDVSL